MEDPAQEVKASIELAAKLRLGMTVAEVEAAIGLPETRTDLGEKVFYMYKNVIVEFKRGKVTGFGFANPPLTRESLPVHEGALKFLGVQLATAQDILKPIFQLEINNETVNVQARKVESMVTEAQRILDVGLEKCRLWKSGQAPLTEHSSAELDQTFGQVTNLHWVQELEKLTELMKSCTSALKESAMYGLDKLSGVEFEGLISRLLEHMGFRAEMTKASGDGGIDIVATLGQPLTGGRYLIQCKRYAPDSQVGAATVREFYGAVTADRTAVKGILITTSGFTSQAEEFARVLPIELIGRDQLQKMLAKYGLGIGPTRIETRSDEVGHPKDRARALFDAALKLREQNRDADAIKLLREATQLQPDDPEMWLWLGICYNFVGLHDDQVAALRKAVALKPDYHMAWHWLGMGLHGTGELDAAIDALLQANKTSSDDAYTWIELGRTYRDKENREGALSAFQKATTLKPDDWNVWFNLGLAHHNIAFHTGGRGKSPDADSAFRKSLADAGAAFHEAILIDPNNAECWFWLCNVYRDSGDRARMLQSVARLEQLDPGRAREFRRNFPSHK